MEHRGWYGGERDGEGRRENSPSQDGKDEGKFVYRIFIDYRIAVSELKATGRKWNYTSYLV